MGIAPDGFCAASRPRWRHEPPLTPCRRRHRSPNRAESRNHGITEEGSAMSLDTTQTEAHHERLTAHEALQRLEHERASRLTQLRALEQTGPDSEEQMTSTHKDTLQRVLTEIEAAFT